MARFVLEAEHFIALVEGHVLQLEDVASGVKIELMLDPHIGWARIWAILIEELNSRAFKHRGDES